MVGLLIPEFPGQTHAFFWRQMQALRNLGVTVEVVSTRRPARTIQPHTWAEQAAAQTHYLFPFSLRAAAGAVGQWLRSGPGGWWRCVTCITWADGLFWMRRLRLVPLALMGAQLAWWARRRGWSHLHVHSCADSANIALFARQLSGLRYSLTLHGPLHDYGANQRQKWSSASFAVIITQRLLREARDALGVEGMPRRVEVASMGVDTDKFQRRRGPYRPCAAGEVCRIFSCGRLNPSKGHQDLIRSLVSLRRRGVAAELHIAGQDEAGGSGYRRALERQIRELDLGGSVHLLGAVPEERVVEELEAAHVFALASQSEPLGVAIMEAMAMQVPVVVTNAGGVPELVDEGVDGLLVPPADPEALAGAIARIATDAELALRLSANQRRKIERSFHHGLSAEVLARLIAEDAGGAAPWLQRRKETVP